ncbi:ubiquitin ligase (cullin) of SCF [Coemansia sp. Benny D160-2]|nr:ubiquitin ligase (cullin) of SCF [Coemansia sp. Benny D160-2]
MDIFHFDINAFLADKLTDKDFSKILPTVFTQPKDFDSGKNIYICLNDTAIAIASGFCKNAEKIGTSESLIKYYLNCWKRFQRLSSSLDYSLIYFRKHWHENECNYNPSYVSVSDTMQQIWYMFFFEPSHRRLEEAIMSVITSERANGVPVGNDMVQQYWKAMAALRPPRIERIRVPFRIDLGTYTRFYETPYVSAALVFIKKQTNMLATEQNIRMYIDKLHSLIESEMERGTLYLHESSLKFMLRRLINDNFVRGVPCTLISKDAVNMLNDSTGGSIGLLRSAFLLLQGLDDPKVLEELATALQAYMQKAIIQDYDDASTTKDSTSPKVVEIIQATHKKNLIMLEKHFGPTVPPQFTISAKIALAEAVNLKSQKNGVYIEYYHSLLRKDSVKMYSGDVDIDHAVRTKIDNAAIVVKALKNKLEFVTYYHMWMARRLARNDYLSLDLELYAVKSFVFEDIKQSLTQNATDMCRLALVSKDLTNGFKAFLAKSSTDTDTVDDGNDIDIHINLFKATTWPDAMTQNKDDYMLMPAALAPLSDKFESFYKTEYESKRAKRDVLWNYVDSSVVAHFYFPHAPKVKYTLMLNMYQLSILTQFTQPSVFEAAGGGSSSNGLPNLSREKLSQLTGIAEKRLLENLDILVQTRILIRQQRSGGAKGKSSSEDDGMRYALNNKFNPKTKRINIHALRHKQSQREEAKAVELGINFRKMGMETKITSLAKAKQMTYSEMFKMVSDEFKGRFTVVNDEFKEVVELLIFKGYIERDDGDRGTLRYQPMS